MNTSSPAIIQMIVPYLDLKRQLESAGDEIGSAITRVLNGGTYILGDEVQLFESEWASFCGTAGAVGVATGTDALVLALKATGAVREGKNDEVITAPLTAGYTALGIKLAGGVPVFADIDPRSYMIDPQSIEDSITPRTRAIVPVHLYGQMADMKSVFSIAEKHGLIVVEDAAQAHGARLDGESAGAFSDAAGFSFYPTKNLGAFGDGGIVTAQDQTVLRKARMLRQGGHYEPLQSTETGLNSRLDELQAAILRVKLRHLESWNDKRRKIAELYNAGLSGISSIQLPEARNSESHVFHLYVISHPKRDELRAYLLESGIETMIHYPYLLHQQPLFRRVEQAPLPVAEKIGPTILSLPLNPWLRTEEIEYVIDRVIRFESI